MNRTNAPLLAGRSLVKDERLWLSTPVSTPQCRVAAWRTRDDGSVVVVVTYDNGGAGYFCASELDRYFKRSKR